MFHPDIVVDRFVEAPGSARRTPCQDLFGKAVNLTYINVGEIWLRKFIDLKLFGPRKFSCQFFSFLNQSVKHLSALFVDNSNYAFKLRSCSNGSRYVSVKPMFVSIVGPTSLIQYF